MIVIIPYAMKTPNHLMEILKMCNKFVLFAAACPILWSSFFDLIQQSQQCCKYILLKFKKIKFPWLVYCYIVILVEIRKF